MLIYRLSTLALMAAFLSGCTGIVPSGYRGKWSCTDTVVASNPSLRIEISGSTVSWPRTSMMPAWTAEVEGVSPDGDGHWLQLKGGPYGMLRIAMRPGGITLERFRCSAA